MWIHQTQISMANVAKIQNICKKNQNLEPSSTCTLKDFPVSWCDEGKNVIEIRIVLPWEN